MPVKTEATYLGDFLKYEAEALYCREPVTVLAALVQANENEALSAVFSR